ncbi:unnamed protein product [Cylicocyclus nassatus]|uniref:Uncharacterized protein n=1 Tax=Cylicocyclus nassatus TaxID=53992 RepID=A0AA36MED7_CYLNA|nr:unnamed protein product [Cylicocyclus nassatus]
MPTVGCLAQLEIKKRAGNCRKSAPELPIVTTVRPERTVTTKFGASRGCLEAVTLSRPISLRSIFLSRELIQNFGDSLNLIKIKSFGRTTGGRSSQIYQFDRSHT